MCVGGGSDRHNILIGEETATVFESDFCRV
jgi:hypothetical protein